MNQSNLNKICNLDDVKDGNSLGLSATINGITKKLIVLKDKNNVFVYVNSCPHIGTPLDLRPGQFLSHDKKNIICSTHGALFQTNTGLCIFGPCKGQYLEGIPICIKNDKIFYNPH
ncbi:MAG: Rieske 2Fe-2S domain-containing protein [Pseudomonadota bacterium]|nr:Rieske 2Fe-2S domain-containing protein [Pseudomonadota bacterium]